MVRLPPDYSDIIALADWFELTALEAGDHNTSAGDLTSALSFLLDDDDRNDKAEELSLEVMAEINFRVKAAADAYPFEVRRERILQTRGDWRTYVPYIFCLCLSYFGWKPAKGVPVNPWELFEELASVAAKTYLCGEVYRFGHSADSAALGFEPRVNELCKLLGEGSGYSGKNNLRRKDDKVDVVAWKHFGDGLGSKLIMFGQCAAGANWETKVSELQPNPFWDNWMASPALSPLLRSFYIPFRLPIEKFNYVAAYAGIVFERCRIAHSVWGVQDKTLADERYKIWCQTVFPSLKL